MKVLVNTVDLERIGGVAGYYRDVRPYLSEDVEYFTVGSRKDGDKGLKTLWRMAGDYVRFYRTLSRGDYDLVHLNPSFGNRAIVRDGIFLLLAKSRGKKTVVFMRGWDEGFERRVRERFLTLFRKVYSKTDAFIVLGSVFKNRLVEMGLDKKFFLTNTVVEDAAIENAPDRSDRDGFHVLFLARVEKDKGAYEALEAYRLLKEKFPHVTMTFAGDGSELENVKRAAEEKQIADVEFPGFLRGEEKRKAFQRADIYLFPSYHEGMPGSVLQAMGYGLPVVTRAVGGLPDFFEHEKMGFITESYESTVFADYMERLVTDPQRRLEIGKTNHDFAAQRFVASAAAHRLESIYRELLEEK